MVPGSVQIFTGSIDAPVYVMKTRPGFGRVAN
jgi:hypothetical protein